MVDPITEADASTVSREDGRSNRLNQDGKYQVTKRKPHATDVAFVQSLRHSF